MIKEPRNVRRYYAISLTLIAIIFIMGLYLYLLFSFPPSLTLSNMFDAPIVPVPIDGGWIGLILIFANGFLLSYFLAEDGVNSAERLLLSIGLGFGSTFAIMILIGMLWEINLTTAAFTQIILLTALVIVSVYRKMKQRTISILNIRKTLGISRLGIFAAATIILVSVYIIAAMYKSIALPAIEWDSLAYGVNYAKIIFEKGNIPLIAGPSIGLEMSASYPPGVQLVAATLYNFAGAANDFYYKILSPIFGIATIITTYKFAWILSRDKIISIIAVLSLSVVPFFWELFVQETYFLALILMLNLSAFFLFKAYNSAPAEGSKFEILATLFCSFSALTSYIGLASFGLLLFYGINRRLSLKRFAWLSALFLAVILPWYSRNFLLLGNPIYPFLGVGEYLDPLLLSSTMQHFQNYATIPIYAWSIAIGKIGAIMLVLAMAYLTFSKQKNLLMIFPSKLKKTLLQIIPSYLQNRFFIIVLSYLLLVGILIMVIHLPFPRYIIVALPCSAIFFSVIIKLFFTLNNLTRVIAITLISMVAISSTFVLPYMNSAKPTARPSDDKWSYLIHVFREADAWKWINENTPLDARIATYDIKEYYLERDILLLDGNESAPLYQVHSIEEGINFLQDKGITYVLSVPWASPMDPRLPPAYKLCIITKYLGDPRYLPPVYVGANGATVYQVGPMEEKTIYEQFAKKEFAPPIKHVTINTTVTNNTYPYIGRLYIPLPVDYREGKMVLSANSSQSIEVELWTGLIPTEMIAEPGGEFMFVRKWFTESSNSSDIENSLFEWQVDRAGYFTFRIVAKEDTIIEDFCVTLDLKFYNYWELESL
jgi:hypothetical protein